MIENSLITTIFNRLQSMSFLDKFLSAWFFFLYNIIVEASSSEFIINQVTRDGLCLK
jgi:hypothetical protein